MANCFGYALENSSSDAQQTKSFGMIINGDRQRSSLEQGTAKYIQIHHIICFEFLRKAIVSEVIGG